MITAIGRRLIAIGVDASQVDLTRVYGPAALIRLDAWPTGKYREVEYNYGLVVDGTVQESQEDGVKNARRDVEAGRAELLVLWPPLQRNEPSKIFRRKRVSFPPSDTHDRTLPIHLSMIPFHPFTHHKPPTHPSCSSL